LCETNQERREEKEDVKRRCERKYQKMRKKRRRDVKEDVKIRCERKKI
jgi:hypothetical protein